MIICDPGAQTSCMGLLIHLQIIGNIWNNEILKNAY